MKVIFSRSLQIDLSFSLVGSGLRGVSNPCRGNRNGLHGLKLTRIHSEQMAVPSAQKERHCSGGGRTLLHSAKPRPPVEGVSH